MKLAVLLIISQFILSGGIMAKEKPLRVYILAGQSNMVGHAKIQTFDYLADDPTTAPMLKDMLGPDGKPLVCDNVWIAYDTGQGGKWGVPFKPISREGKLTAGFGGLAEGEKIGPEFTFGIYMQKHVKEPILIIKTAWGGKSLNTEFRPPSAGPYQLPEDTRKKWEKHPNGVHGVPKESERDEWWKKKRQESGVFYQKMMDHIKEVLGDIKKVYPDYDPQVGYELAGFVWFQGWNDMADVTTYPNANKADGFKEYTNLMGHFIRDIRKELKAAELPFVIGVIGVFGNELDNRWSAQRIVNLRTAMNAVAEVPEFEGNVIAVDTAAFWDKKLAVLEKKYLKVEQMKWNLRRKNPNFANKDGKMTPKQQKEYLKEYKAKLITAEEQALWERATSNGAYHYLGCAKIIGQIGKAFADALANKTLKKSE